MKLSWRDGGKYLTNVVQGLAEASHIVSAESESFRNPDKVSENAPKNQDFFLKSGGKKVKNKSLRQSSKIFLLKSSQFIF